LSTYPGDLLLHLASFVSLLAHVRNGRPGAFEETARGLHVDRSVLRRRIQALGGSFPVPLLEGRGADLRPTAAGARLAERAERILAAVKQLPADVAGVRERVVVGCTGTIASELLPRVVVELERRPRPVQLVVRRAGGALCEDLVREGQIDVGVVRAAEPPAGFASQHLVDDRLWFVVPIDHPLAARARVSLPQIAAVPLVLFGESSRTRARVMQRLGPLGATIRVEVDGRSAALEYVRAGIGATFLSLLPGHRIDARDVHVRDVTRLFGRSRFFVITRRERRSEAVIGEVVRGLTDARLGRRER
jgi:DNA-binding transcriptional LysR family regulator